jgi:diguanylate cyclase (GGDEF)-like protein
MRLKTSITDKLFLSYIFLIIFNIVIGTYAIVNLNMLKNSSDQMINTGVPLLFFTEKLMDCLSVQEKLGKQYFSLKTELAQNQFVARGEEFKNYLTEMHGKGVDKEINAIGKVYGQYLNLFSLALKERDLNQAGILPYQKQMNAAHEITVKWIQNLKGSLIEDEKDQLVHLNTMNQRVLYTLVILCVAGLILGLGFAFLVTSYFTRTIEKIKQTTQMISKGKYDQFPAFVSGDEMGELTESFKSMGKRLKELEALNLDANPLSRLPGNLAIERELLKRIQNQSPLAFCLLDLDNFKAYGDTYGYARGSEVLTVVAGILMQTMQSVGQKEDFIGHIGGDDFILITEPARAHVFCQKIISEFDQTIPHYYDEADRRNGFILAKDRNDVEQKFPVMTISIAVVTNEKRKFTDPGKIAEMAAQLKHYAKTFPKSIYVIDQRRN